MSHQIVCAIKSKGDVRTLCAKIDRAFNVHKQHSYNVVRLRVLSFTEYETVMITVLLLVSSVKLIFLKNLKDDYCHSLQPASEVLADKVSTSYQSCTGSCTAV